MEISRKINTLLKVSGLTQEKLARKIGVSFVTLNAWFNGRSQPHAKNENLINDLYLEFTGQKKIPDSEIDAKKQYIKKLQKEQPKILEKITEDKNLFDHLVLKLTYNTNRIEGSTLTEAETAAVLFENQTLSDHSLIEHLEAKNHQTACRMIFNHVANKKPIDENLILELHQTMMNSIHPEAGFYRKQNVRILGYHIPTANFRSIPRVMNQLICDLQNNKDDIISLATKTHSVFEKIHPFSDGNGRVGRLLIHAMLLNKNLPPALIKEKDKTLYITYLNKSQMTDDYSLLENFLCDAILDTYRILD